MPAFSTNGLRLAAIVVLLPVALSPLWVPLIAPEGFWIARALATIGAALVAASLTWGRPQLALAASPPFVLGVLALIFYCLVPALYTAIFLDGPLTLGPNDGPNAFRLPDSGFSLDIRTSFAVASPGEAAVLCFVGLCLLAVLAFDRLIGAGKSPRRLDLPPVWPLLLIVAAGVLYQLGKAFQVTADIGSLLDLLPAIMTFGVALSGWRALDGGCREFVWAVAAVLAESLLLFPYQMKIASLLLAVCLLAGVFATRGRVRTLLLIAVMGSPLLAAASKLLYVNEAQPFTDRLLMKVVWRQSETVYCLNFALREAADDERAWHAGPVYFAAGLVPRLIWPDKPSLSHGREYGEAFCYNQSPGQSSSITLVGEPILRGGAGGAVTAGVIWLGLMSLVFFAWKRGYGVLPAVALGLSPWLIDFDQDFTLYLALTVKNALAMLAVAAALIWLNKRRMPLQMPDQSR